MIARPTHRHPWLTQPGYGVVDIRDRAARNALSDWYAEHDCRTAVAVLSAYQRYPDDLTHGLRFRTQLIEVVLAELGGRLALIVPDPPSPRPPA